MVRAIPVVAMLVAVLGGVRGAGAEGGPAPGGIKGVVKGTDGNVAANCPVKLYPVKAPEGAAPSKKPGGVDPVATAVTREDGSYVLAQVPAGAYRLIAGQPPREIGFADVRVQAGKVQKVDLALKGRRHF